MTTKIKMWGNSLAVRIPREISKKLKLKAGSNVRVSAGSKFVTIQPLKDEEPKIGDLVSRISEKNKHSIKLNGESVGGEIW